MWKDFWDRKYKIPCPNPLMGPLSPYHFSKLFFPRSPVTSYKSGSNIFTVFFSHVPPATFWKYLIPVSTPSSFFPKHSVSTSLYLSFSHVHAHTHAPTHTIHHLSSDHSFSRSIPLSNIFMYLFPKICLKSFISLYTLSALWLDVLMQYHGFSDPIYMDIKFISPVWHFHF